MEQMFKMNGSRPIILNTILKGVGMKVRNGFVSNSSSSSYILYGIFEEDLPYDIQERIDLFKDNCDGDDDEFLDNLFGQDYDIIAEEICYWSDGAEIISPDISAENLEKIKRNIKEIMDDRFRYDVPDDLFHIIGTTYRD